MSDLELNDGEPGAVRAADTFVMAEISATIATRSYLSTHHLYAARYAAEAAAELEAGYTGPRPAFNIRLRGLVLSAVIESVMFLEAAINEVFQDAADNQPGYINQLDARSLKLLTAFWHATNKGRTRTLDKYDWALEVCGHERFDSARSPYQDAALLIDLRNYLVHYRPENIGHGSESNLIKKLSQGLSSKKFRDNALMPSNGATAWFPDSALGAGCAEWSWRSARTLVDQFAATTGLILNYQNADFGDPLPR